MLWLTPRLDERNVRVNGRRGSYVYGISAWLDFISILIGSPFLDALRGIFRILC
jgi:hypothetical protein